MNTEEELQLFWLGCCLAGAGISTIDQRIIFDFLARRELETPFAYLRRNAEITFPNYLHSRKVPHAVKIARTFRESAELDGLGSISIASATLRDLLGVYGVGPKTARFFILHTKPLAKVAILGHEELDFLRMHFVDVPRETPQEEKEYIFWEDRYLAMLERTMAGVTLPHAAALMSAHMRDALSGERFVGKDAYKKALP